MYINITWYCQSGNTTISICIIKLVIWFLVNNNHGFHKNFV